MIPDVQLKPGVPTEHIDWISQYIIEASPDVLVIIGDWADMPSLSSYDKGTKSFEGRTYRADILAANDGLQMLMAPIEAEIKRRESSHKRRWNLRKIVTLGNHEHRINRAIETQRELDGLISTKDLFFEQWGFEVYPFLKPVSVDGVVYCMSPKHKVLKTDLTYVPLGDIRVGDQIFGFDEHCDGQKNPRRYKTATVQAVDPDSAPLFRVTLSDGIQFDVTADHRWLIRSPKGMRWAHTSELRLGDEIPKLFETWEQENTRSAGWLAGMFDGEGYISKPNCKQGGIQIGMGQNEGPILEQARSELLARGFELFESENGGNSKCRNLKIGGVSGTKLRFLGEMRPERLIRKFKPEMLGRVQASFGNTKIVDISPIGVGEIIKIKTSTATMVVEGYAHHNCHYFASGVMGRPITTAKALLTKLHQSCIAGHQQGYDVATAHRADGSRITGIIAGSAYLHEEAYLNPQTNQHWRGVLTLNDVDNGTFDEMKVSLDYLRRKYGCTTTTKS